MIQKRLSLEPITGKIRNIKDCSRKVTDREFSISEKIANEVLKGKISLKDAIELKNCFKKPKKINYR